MKTNVAIKILFIFSIVLQSFNTVYAAGEFHQLDIEHLQTVHDHANDSVDSISEHKGDTHNVNDCHHCGHCSGTHIPWFGEKNTENNLPLRHHNSFQSFSSKTQKLPKGIYRPPIT